jgi:hypothetical protein
MHRMSGASMLEIVICCFIVFVVGYWAALWVMGRNDDVLHGQFLETEARVDRPVFVMPTPPPKVASRPKLPPPRPTASARLPVHQKPASTEELNVLLASLKQELKKAAKL